MRSRLHTWGQLVVNLGTNCVQKRLSTQLSILATVVVLISLVFFLGFTPGFTSLFLLSFIAISICYYDTYTHYPQSLIISDN